MGSEGGDDDAPSEAEAQQGDLSWLVGGAAGCFDDDGAEADGER